MKLIVGLGNPGKEYELTRHNIGFLALDAIADKLEIPFTQAKCKGLFGEGRVQQEKVILLKPMTYMNLSGESIRAIIDFYKINIQDVLVLYDELDLPSGAIKLRVKGGANGHNGIKSIISHLGTEEFKRIKMGIGRPVHGDIVSFVLGRFSIEEQGSLESIIQKATEATLSFIEESDFTKVMNRHNG